MTNSNAYTLHYVDTVAYLDGQVDDRNGNGKVRLARRTADGAIFGVDLKGTIKRGIEVSQEGDFVAIRLLGGRDDGNLVGHVDLDDRLIWSEQYGLLRGAGCRTETGLSISAKQAAKLGL